MNLISIENLSKSYSEKILLNKISFGINEGEKIGIIGVNGTGKSTLLKIIAGLEECDEGTIIKNNKVNIEYLPQTPEFDDNSTVLEQIFKGNSPVIVALKNYENIIEKLDKDPNDNKLSEKLISLSAKIDALDGWDLESRAKTILTKLGIKDFDKKVSTLSGGQKKRIALAQVLISPAELLILDEPTNHMDNESIAWLEEFLNSRKGSVLMITHDRYFLDRVSNRILEIDHGRLFSYEGNFSSFLEKKVEREELESAKEDKRQNLLRRELAWIRRGAKARSTKQKARIDRFQELSSEDPINKNDNLEISTAHSRLGNKIIILDKVNKNFNEKNIIKDFSYIMTKDDRIGIIGPNGIGKSTLMNLIANRLKPDSGEVVLGETVKLGYFSQSNYNMDENLRVIEYIKETAEFILTKEGDRISASQMLEKFLFPPEAQWTPIYKLSGGERRRLFLLKILMEAPNILLLDEPTNDLDIATLEILEDYIENFNGPIMTVSHDRYFLDKIANKIFSYEGNGQVLEHTGNYSDFIEYKRNLSTECEQLEENKNQTVNNSNKKIDDPIKKEKKLLKLSYKDQREYDEIESIIENIENTIVETEDEITKNASNYSKLQELLVKKESLEKKLEKKMERWEYLNELVEEINANKKLEN
ncbi:ABC-F family ATP-binding cassette domain-containing protein [Hathewaya limosa]|uniref:ATP-binding cassette subfamily F protein uup n=1 Tax=Hathewaya limosa TaxID=1536 RepID=A0ABU0JUI5_HATLI|nr:ABC-F family ATP-binding cassette domain-containing protein [Hathewaya limosa]MDQ0480767.1 ATP-binding cassette subfamily F protein uup [Hathewaya limosa]